MVKKLILFLGVVLCLGMKAYQVPTTMFNSTQKEWNQILDSINYDKEQNFILYWSGLGGSVSMAERIFNRIKYSGKNVTIIITGDAISSHALVACYLKDKVQFNQGVLVLHNVFTGRDSSGRKIFDDSETRRLLNTCINAGWLTKKEADVIVTEKARMEIYPNGNRRFYPDFL